MFRLWVTVVGLSVSKTFLRILVSDDNYIMNFSSPRVGRRHILGDGCGGLTTGRGDLVVKGTMSWSLGVSSSTVWGLGRSVSVVVGFTGDPNPSQFILGLPKTPRPNPLMKLEEPSPLMYVPVFPEITTLLV